MTYTNFANAANHPRQKCAAFDVPPNIGQWNDIECHKNPFCFACEIKNTFTIRMRGLCEDDIQATYFFFKDLKNMFKYNIMLVYIVWE